MRESFQKFLSRVFQSGVAWGIVGIGIRFCSAAVLLPLTTRMVPSEELAFWYIFTTILGLVVVLDFGLTSTSARKIAALRTTAESADDHSFSNFLSYVSRAFRVLAFVTFGILSLGGGWWVWERSAGTSAVDTVRWAWLLMCPSFFLSVIGNLGRSRLFGTNRLQVFQMISAFAYLAQLVVTLGGLLLNLHIKALVLGNLALFVVMALTAPFSRKRLPAISWRPTHFQPTSFKELLRSSSGTFSNSVSAYLVLNAGVLVASRFLPLADTASYGLSLQIFLLVGQVSAIWIDIKHPLYASLYQNNLPELRSIFISRMRLTLVTFMFCTTGIITIGNSLLRLFEAKTYLLPAPELVTISIFVLLYLHQSEFECLSLGLDKNPFIASYLISAITGFGLSCVLAAPFGVAGVLMGPFLTQLAFNNWWVPFRTLRVIQIHPIDYLRRLCFLPAASIDKDSTPLSKSHTI